MRRIFLIILFLFSVCQAQMLVNGFKHTGSSSLLTNLISYWKLDGNSTDSYSSNNGTDANITYSTGKINNGAYFNSTSSEIGFGDISAIHSLTTFSFSLWLYANGTTAAGDKDIISKWNYPTQGSFALQTITGSSNGLSIFIATSPTDDGSGCRVDVASVLTGNTWYHIVVVYDGTQTGNANRLKVYVNGTSQTTTQAAGNVPSSLTAATSNLVLGHFEGVGRWLDGRIDEVGIWSKALTSTEVTTLYNSGTGIQYPF